MWKEETEIQEVIGTNAKGIKNLNLLSGLLPEIRRQTYSYKYKYISLSITFVLKFLDSGPSLVSST